MISNPIQTEKELVSGLLDWLANNSSTVTIVVLGLLMLLLLGVAYYFFRHSRQPTSVDRNLLRRNSRRAKAASKKAVSGWVLLDVSGQDIPLKPLPFSIGREGGNALVLDDRSVSAQHARIYYDPAFDSLVIEDLDSVSGILVEGQPTRKNLLQSGMQVTVGRYTFTLTHQAS